MKIPETTKQRTERVKAHSAGDHSPCHYRGSTKCPIALDAFLLHKQHVQFIEVNTGFIVQVSWIVEGIGCVEAYSDALRVFL